MIARTPTPSGAPREAFRQSLSWRILPARLRDCQVKPSLVARRKRFSRLPRVVYHSNRLHCDGGFPGDSRTRGSLSDRRTFPRHAQPRGGRVPVQARLRPGCTLSYGIQLHGFPRLALNGESRPHDRYFGPSRHFAALQNLVAIQAYLTWPDLLPARPGRDPKRTAPLGICRQAQKGQRHRHRVRRHGGPGRAQSQESLSEARADALSRRTLCCQKVTLH